ncbi:hypothetical protein EJ07DRAFT_170417 [Lizonia empirigonia]|nr:hypothetical protein EJ07DRAFT_170417 [Lizonia empirigonia]
MSTAVWPPMAADQLARAQAESQQRELGWLLEQLTETLQALKAGLDECAALLAPSETGSTLVLSSVRSESLKGLVTRVGTRIVKGNVKLRMRGAQSLDVAISAAPAAPTLVVPQLTAVRTAINSCLDAIDVVSWGGDATDASFVAGQLQLLHDHMREACHALKGYSDVHLPWWAHPLDDQIFNPPLPPNLSFHMFIFDAALCLEVRTLEPKHDDDAASFTAFNFRDRLSLALGGTRTPLHDEADKVYKYKGQDVRVKEKIRVEAQDPALISALAKLNALEHSLTLSRNALDIIMGRDDPDTCRDTIQLPPIPAR